MNERWEYGWKMEEMRGEKKVMKAAEMGQRAEMERRRKKRRRKGGRRRRGGEPNDENRCSENP